MFLAFGYGIAGVLALIAILNRVARYYVPRLEQSEKRPANHKG